MASATVVSAAATNAVSMPLSRSNSGADAPICHSGRPVSHQRVSTTTSPTECSTTAGRIESVAQVSPP